MKSKNIFIVLCFLLCNCLLLACNAETIISEEHSDTEHSMEVSNYTTTLEEEIIIGDSQSASISAIFARAKGDIEVMLTDMAGKKVLSMNQDASLSNVPAVTHIYEKGTYHLTVNLQHYTGSFDVSWRIDKEDTQETQDASLDIPSGISDDITMYGLLSCYDVGSRVLDYIPVEIIDSSDTDRIKELESHGVELEFPNGYFVYQPNDSNLSFPVTQSVAVTLLNDEFTLEESSIEAVSERLEGHPPFFLCEIHIIEGKIVDIEERFVP